MSTKNIEIVKALDKIRMNNLYVHNEKYDTISFSTNQLKKRPLYIVETLAVINALVDRGTMLLYGGHGGGKTTLAKYLGQIFHRKSKDGIEECVLRGHPQLTEEKILGTMDVAQLTGAKPLNKANNIDILWNSFVDSPWKIIDELNRLSPYAQNILLSLLAESSVKYHNESKRLPNYSLYATLNPKDDANFTMSLPFLDRFAIAIPMTMPDYESLSTIGKLDKSSKYDDVSNYLTSFELDRAQNEVREAIIVSEDAELFINYIISSYRLCQRITKEVNDRITVDTDLCKECHYSAPGKVCNKILHPLSVRVKEDLFRYSKALAWYLGDTEVRIEHIHALAPYMIWHRSQVSRNYLKSIRDSRFTQRNFSINIELEATRTIIDIILEEFKGIKSILKDYERIKRGELSVTEFGEYETKIRPYGDNILIIEKDLMVVLREYHPVYAEIIAICEDINKASKMDELMELKEKLVTRYDIPNRNYIADLIEKKRRIIGAESMKSSKYKVFFDDFYSNTESQCQELYHILKTKFQNNFDPVINKLEELSNIGDSEFTLKMKRVNLSKQKDGIIFEYLGSKETSICKYLEKMNAFE